MSRIETDTLGESENKQNHSCVQFEIFKTKGYKMSTGEYKSKNYLNASFKLFCLFISLPSFTSG